MARKPAVRWVRRDGQGVRCRLGGVVYRYSMVATVQRDIDNLGKVIAQLEARLARERESLATLYEVRGLVAEIRHSYGFLKVADRHLLPGRGEKPADGQPGGEPGVSGSEVSPQKPRRYSIRRLDPAEVRRRSDARSGSNPPPKP